MQEDMDKVAPIVHQHLLSTKAEQSYLYNNVAWPLEIQGR